MSLVIYIIVSCFAGIFIGFYLTNLDYDAMHRTLEINNYLYKRVEKMEKEIEEFKKNDRV